MENRVYRKTKILLTLVVALVLISSTTAFAEHWGDIPVKYMMDNGYLQAIDGNANPDDYVSRLDVAKALARLPLIDKGSNYIFTDTCDKDVIKVAKSGLMNGSGNQLFKLEDNISREEITKVLASMLSNAQSAAEITFDDKDDIGEWAKPYVASLVNEKIILGYEDNTFRPRNNITRAEFAVLFMKVRDAYTITSITGNVFNNATVIPVTFLEIPDGTIGLLSIPSLGLNNLPIVENGENLDNIKSKAGHFSDTAVFDGNVGLLGHNFTDKSPWFGKLANIHVGDKIVWKTKFGIRYYSVTIKQNISAEDWSSLIEAGDNRITLITCLAGQSQTTRIMVQGVEVK